MLEDDLPGLGQFRLRTSRNWLGPGKSSSVISQFSVSHLPEDRVQRGSGRVQGSSGRVQRSSGRVQRSSGRVQRTLAQVVVRWPAVRQA
jgi:hypothetical protein